jgi:hypothetical protein
MPAGAIQEGGKDHMATKIKIVNSGEFLEVTPEGMVNLETSRQLLLDIAKTEHTSADYELFIDFRDTHAKLSIMELYQLASELFHHGDTFHRRMAILVKPGINFDRAKFFETCSVNRGYDVNAFTDYEKAMRWVLSPEEKPNPENDPDGSSNQLT